MKNKAGTKMSQPQSLVDKDIQSQICSKRAAAFSAVKPYSLKIRSPGAEAPQVSIVKVFPLRPIYLPQPKLEPASIARRLVTEGGSTSSL